MKVYLKNAMLKSTTITPPHSVLTLSTIYFENKVKTSPILSPSLPFFPFLELAFMRKLNPCWSCSGPTIDLDLGSLTSS